MDRLDISLMIISGGFGLMIVMWNSINNRMDSLDKKIDRVDMNLSQKVDKLDEKVTDIDRRLCRLEGAFAFKRLLS